MRKRNPLSIETAISIATLAALVGGGYLLYSWLKKNPGSFNPASDKNLVYQGANKILQSMTGNKVDSVGTATANVFKSSEEKAVDAMLRAPVLSKNLSISNNPFDSGVKRNAGAEALDTASMIMYGLGDLSAARFRNYTPRRKLGAMS